MTPSNRRRAHCSYSSRPPALFYLLDPLCGLDEVHPVVVVLVDTGGDRKDVGVEDYVLRGEAHLRSPFNKSRRTRTRTRTRETGNTNHQCTLSFEASDKTNRTVLAHQVLRRTTSGRDTPPPSVPQYGCDQRCSQYYVNLR